MKQAILTIVSLIAILCSASCSHSSKDDGRQILLVSIEPQRKMLQELVGDHFTVEAMLPRGTNPETFEPTVAQRMQAEKAAAYFAIGYLPFETVLAADINKKEAPVFNVSEGITPVTGTHAHGDHVHEDQADPHVWTSVKNAKDMAATMLNAMKEIDPDNTPDYIDNYMQMALRYDSLDNAIEQQLRKAGAHAFAVWHPSLSYYARDYGLHQISVGQESKEISIGTLKSIIDEAREDSVKVFFFQKEYDSRQAENINKEIGSRIVTINPLDYEWEEQLIQITNELTR